MESEKVYRRAAKVIKRQKSLLGKEELRTLGVCETSEQVRRR